MRTAVLTPTALILSVGGCVVAVLIGAALLPRGPDLSVAPQMAKQPVILPGAAAIYVQKYEVSIAEWNSCYDEGACKLNLRAPANLTAAETPATGLSYVDVNEYLSWINSATGKEFRLPTLKEWDFMAAEVTPEAPALVFTDPALAWAATYLLEPQTKRVLRPRGSFETTSEGIADLNGSVWEWTSECFAGASQGTITPDRCPAFFVGGEHVAAIPFLVRDPARGGCAVGNPPAHLGMRLVTDQRI